MWEELIWYVAIISCPLLLATSRAEVVCCTRKDVQLRRPGAGDQETVHLAQLSPASYHAVHTVISDTPALVCGRIQLGVHQHGCLTKVHKSPHKVHWFNPYYYVILLNKWWNKSIRWNMIKRWRWQNLSVQGEEWVPCLDCPVCIQMWIHKWSEKLCRWQCLTPRWAGQTKSTPPMVKHFTFQTFLCYSSHKQIMYVGHHELIILIIYLCNLYILDDNMDC